MAGCGVGVGFVRRECVRGSDHQSLILEVSLLLTVHVVLVVSVVSKILSLCC